MTSAHMTDTELSLSQRACLVLISGYKVLLSQLFTGSCRFVPSCSDYARDAIVVHGVLRGSWFALGRLSRCRPAGGFGVDPVPPASH